MRDVAGERTTVQMWEGRYTEFLEDLEFHSLRSYDFKFFIHTWNMTSSKSNLKHVGPRVS